MKEHQYKAMNWKNKTNNLDSSAPTFNIFLDAVALSFWIEHALKAGIHVYQPTQTEMQFSLKLFKNTCTKETMRSYEDCISESTFLLVSSSCLSVT